MMARVRYIIFSCLSLTHIEKAIIKGKKCETIYFKCLTWWSHVGTVFILILYVVTILPIYKTPTISVYPLPSSFLKSWIYICIYISTGSEFYVCRGLVTFDKSNPPIQEFPFNLPLIKELAAAFGTVARIALPRALHALRACKKQEKNAKTSLHSFAY